MSSFTGKFREYPSISADNFEKGNLDSLAFFLSHCHKDHMSGLDSATLHHRFKTSKTLFLYCSETTENLLMCNPTYSHLKDYIRSIPLDQQTIVPLIDEKTGQQSSVCVTLLPAGHCVGSVMFLFEGPGGNVLYTGDFRLAKGDAKRISFFHAYGRVKDIKSVYIDTTFCLPRMKSLPSRQQSREAIIKLIDRWFSRGPEYAVTLLCKGMYGFEYLLKEVAMNYRTKIHVSAERLAMYKYLPDMTPYFTTDGRSTKIHACNWQAKQNCDSDLPCGSAVHPSVKAKVLRIKPTSMWVARDTEPMPADFKRYDKGKKLWRVVHSMHASMEEIEDLVGYLRPYHVYPNVPPAGLDTLEDAFERLKGLTRIKECDSCNQDESGEERFKEHAASHTGDGITANNQTLEEKAALRKIKEFAPPAPDEKVLAVCKELGLDKDESLTPPPKRRKARRQGLALEEKTSVSQHPQGTSSCKDNTNQEESKTQENPSYPTGEGNQERLPNFDEMTKCHSANKLKTVDENQMDYNVSEESSRSSILEHKYYDQKSFSDSVDSTVTNQGNNKCKIDCSYVTDPKTTSRCPVSFEKLSGSEEKYSQGPVGRDLPGSKADFDVPPSPGHVKPRPGKLSEIHKLLQNGEPISITKILKF